MKLFNAQSEDKLAVENKKCVALNPNLESKVLSGTDVLLAVTGGFNPVKTVWPPVENSK